MSTGLEGKQHDNIFADHRLDAPSIGMLLAAVIVNPMRPHRVEPRAKKRRPKKFPFMRKPWHALRQALIQHTVGD